jgi:pimeloyl-ACP methyl ester carboxylesterase
VGRPARRLLEEPEPETEKPLEAFLQADTVKLVYTHGHPKPELISPDNWNMDLHYLDRPNARRVQLDFFYDYRTNVQLYPQWQAFLRRQQPRTIIFWGQDDIFFTREGGESYLKDLPNAEMHRLNSGHFAVEDSLTYIADNIKAFYAKKREPLAIERVAREQSHEPPTAPALHR